MGNAIKIKYSPEDAWKRIWRIINKRHHGNVSEFARHLKFSDKRIFNRMYGETIPNSLLEAIKIYENISSDFILFGDTTPYSIPKELLED